MDNFNLRKYLAEGKILKEDEEMEEWNNEFGDDEESQERLDNEDYPGKIKEDDKNDYANIKEYLEPSELEDLGYGHGEKYFNYINPSLYNQPYFEHYLSGFAKGLKDNSEASRDYTDSIDMEDEAEKSNKLNEISFDAIDRMEGLANIQDLKTMKDMLRILSTDWMQEGFGKWDIAEYMSHLVNKI